MTQIKSISLHVLLSDSVSVPHIQSLCSAIQHFKGVEHVVQEKQTNSPKENPFLKILPEIGFHPSTNRNIWTLEMFDQGILKFNVENTKLQIWSGITNEEKQTKSDYYSFDINISSPEQLRDIVINLKEKE